MKITFLLFFFLCGNLSSQVNSITPWKTGIDFYLLKTNHYSYGFHTNIATKVKKISTLFELFSTFAYGIGFNSELCISAGYRSVGKTKRETGINDIACGIKYVPLLHNQSPSTSPQAKILKDDLDIVCEAVLSLPTGDYRKGLGTGSFGITLCGALEKTIKNNVDIYSELSYRSNSRNADGIFPGNVFIYSLGVKYILSNEINLYSELKGFNHSATIKNDTLRIDDGYDELYIVQGIGYQMYKRNLFYGSILFGINAEAANTAIYAGVTF